MKLVIVGGVAGGASAATRARRLDEQAEIILFERGPDVSFANCGLPYYLGGEIETRDKLLVAKPGLLEKRFRIDVRTRHNVEAINREAKTVRVRDLASDRVYEESYEKLILSPGAAPIKPPIPGVDLPGVFTLRNLEDVDRIKAAMNGKVSRALIVGAGFIGLELAENLTRQGIAATVVELQNQVLPPLDSEMTTPIADELRANGVTLILGDSAEQFERSKTDGLTTTLKSGRIIEADLVLLCVGVRPENTLAKEAGLAVGERGGIKVNDKLQTDDPDIYAVGDAIEVTDFVTHQSAQIPLAGPANRQGRLAADHIMGMKGGYYSTQGTAIVGVFSKTAAITGASEKSLKRAGVEYKVIVVHGNNHAGYYPGAEPLTLKVLIHPQTGWVLGAQAVGGAGVDKKIDVLSLAVQEQTSVYDLSDLELAYAPQFGSAKDLINIVGFIGVNLFDNVFSQIAVESVMDAPPESRPFLLDVRTPEEFARGAIPGAVNIPIDELRERLNELPRDHRLAVYCQVGQRGYAACRILSENGFNNDNLIGGYKTYKMHYPEG